MFAGFTDSDFEAYAPKKWKSNVFNRERLEVKQKLLALGKELTPALVATDGSALLCEASVEHPALWNHKQVEAQHLFFARNQASRKELDRIIDRARSMATMLEDPTPQRNHLFLCITLSHERIELALRLHPDARVDRQNLERKLAEVWERSVFLDLVRGLPDGYRVEVTGGAATTAGQLDDVGLRDLLAALARPEAPGQTHWLTIGRSVPRAEVKAAGAGLVASARSDLSALLPIYQFIAWTRENDFVSMREVLKAEKQTQRQKGLAKHDRVRIVRGLFAGRAGIIQELDARGAMKVLVGTLAVKVAADEVEKA